MATYEQITYGSPDGAQLGRTDDKVAFYGAVPVVQRPYSSAVHATAAVVTSASYGATQVAMMQEIQKTLIGLGIWATA